MAMLSTSELIAMHFPERLTALRKQKGLTQTQLAERVGVAVLQIRRYEAGSSQPTLDVIRRLAVALAVSSDMLIFDKDERAPANGLLYQFEAINQLTQDEQAIVREVLEGLIIKYQARRWDSARPPLTPRQAGQEMPAS